MKNAKRSLVVLTLALIVAVAGVQTFDTVDGDLKQQRGGPSDPVHG